MNYYKLKIAYDGTNYQGWQAQNDVPTITNTLLNSFEKVFNTKGSLIGASRTDAGVHAMEQIARFGANLDIDVNTLMNAWNNSLPKDITIISIETTTEAFHPIRNVEEKTYYYHFFIQNPLPFTQRYGYYHYWALDINKLEACLKIFEGTHDFRSFSTGYEMRSTIRTINSINLEFIPEMNGYRITVKGKSFLHHMIRRIVGASLDVATKKRLNLDHIITILAQKNPNQALLNAPAKGLVLQHIRYK